MVELFATNDPPKKWIKFTLNDGVGMLNIVVAFLTTASVCIFLGEDPDDSHLPSGWYRPYLQPHTMGLTVVYVFLF